MLLDVIRYLILVYCLVGLVIQAQHEFSGVYHPDLEGSKQAEDFAAAFLVSKKRFIDSYPSIHKATNMAGVSFAVTRHNMKLKRNQVLMSRDYFDFLVEHLSTTSNYIPSGNEKIFRIYNMRLRQTSLKLKGIATNRPIWKDEPRLNQSVVVIPYSSISFSRGHATVQTKIRRGFISSTFWSIYRYIPNIVIYVASDKDRIAVEDMQLPFYQIHQLEVPVDHQNKTILLPRYSLEQSIEKLKTNPDGKWGEFQYVYFTEGDQILHMRHASGIFDAIDNMGGMVSIVPHRMQTMPLAITLRRAELRRLFDKPVYGYINMNVSIATESLELPDTQGSCCDNGRLVVAHCGPRWYQCPQWGLRDVSPWLQFGDTGFTFGQATAHMGSCSFSSQRRLCPLPSDCTHRVPPPAADGGPSLLTDVCREIPTRTHMGPKG